MLTLRQLVLFFFALFMGACDPSVETIDIFEDERVYEGAFEQNRLSDAVKEVEPSDIKATLYPCDGEQCTKVRFSGRIRIYGIAFWGYHTEVVQVTIDDVLISCEYPYKEFTLLLDGEFFEDLSSVEVTFDVNAPFLVKPIWLGDMTLRLVEDDDDDES